MKKCNEVIELMSLYIDNELDNETRNKIDEHIKTCESCKSELDALKEIVGVLGSFEEVELPLGFKEELHEKLVAEKNQNELENKTVQFRKKFAGFASSIAAGLVLVFVAGSLILTRGLLGNAPKDSNKLLMKNGGASEATLNHDNNSNIFGHEEDSQIEILFNEGSKDSSQDQKYDIGAGDTKAKGFRQYDASSPVDPPSEEPALSMITALNAPSYDVYITITSSDIEKETDNINNIAHLCNIEIETYGSKDASVSSPDENKKVLSFDVDSTKYNSFVNELKKEYGVNLSLDEKLNDQDATIKVEISILKE
ncbi:anti-sigma factor family protein [Acetivibrio straminisolvens]|jgi:hypothetical protein|uniref:Anti-sigma-W factor RsiW n=1 Tax=Acetivibrio straminisolvens JCM 21531 TaxID=1294263 RepID=W4V8C7_9FIRM|nr:zf-HC2 domain-containing protein [Acetivibrio straminisolvens]GAE89088.1 hypothetical protein JCM21531_2582 [Acetivibrio straminisolvens JCM 21531]